MHVCVMVVVVGVGAGGGGGGGCGGGNQFNFSKLRVPICFVLFPIYHDPLQSFMFMMFAGFKCQAILLSLPNMKSMPVHYI